MKITFITTVLNEEESIDKLLTSLNSQTVLPDEVVIVDGGSRDQTVARIKNYELGIKNKAIKFKLIEKKGNRSVGRNEAIRNATGDIIACSDAGCTLDKNWVKNITKPFKNKNVDVVAGYYKGNAKTIFQKCLIPYVLVMPDRVNPKEFLPATRSMSFKKSAWKKVGRFDETLNNNEDYAFAKKLKKGGFVIKFAKDAIVHWTPPKSLKKAFIMFFRFAYGDAESKIYRPKVIAVFGRYMVGLILLLLYLYTSSIFLLMLIGTLLGNYVLWTIAKNYRYVNDKKAFIYLPLLQFTADFSVLLGTSIGFVKSFFVNK